MLIRLLIGILLGAGAGAIIGHFGKCSSGTCPLTATPVRGALYGAVIGTLLTLSSGTARTATSAPEGEQPLPGKGLIHITTQETFNQYTTHPDLPCLIDFYSDRCPPCHQLSPTIDQLAKHYNGRAIICKLNVDTFPQAARSYGIQATPTVLFFKNGKEINRLIGLKPQTVYEEALTDITEQPKPGRAGTTNEHE